MIRSLIATMIGAALAVSVASAQLAPPRVIILVGPPGSGKTTQAKLLAKKYGIPAFSMADLLKKQMSAHKKDDLSRALAAPIASGDVLPDDAASDLIRAHLLRVNLRKGFILDGYPSTVGQAKALDGMLDEQQLPKAVVVVFEASDEVIRKRMGARGRADDKPEIIDRRIQEFREEASLLTEWAGKTHVVGVNANASVAEVSAQVVAGLEKTWLQQKFARRP
jgi:adenylate kinase